MSGYEALANAIILQAVKDFRAAYKRVKRFPDDKLAESEVRDLTAFFCSEWFEMLSAADGPALLRRIIDEIDTGGSARMYRKRER